MLSYNQKDNQSYGSCFQHGKETKLQLDCFADCEALQNAVDEDVLHIPKECLVAGLASLNENKPLQPMLIWPTCSKKEEGGIKRIILETNNEIKKKHGFPLLNVCTDGDASRRQLMGSMMQEKVDDKYAWFQHISNLPLVDYTAGPDGITTNFDPKHLVKRCWRMVLSGKILLNGIFL